MKRTLATVAVTAAVLLGLGACTPSGLEIEERTTRSAYKALTGKAASGAVTCALEPVEDGGDAQRYTGECTVHRVTFAIAAEYDGQAATVYAAAPPEGGFFRVHTCRWGSRPGDTWGLARACTSSSLPDT